MVGTAKITYLTLESQAYNNSFSIIDTRAFVPDPRDPAGNHVRTFVYDSDPFMNAYNFELLPYIIVSMPLLEHEFTTVDGKTRKLNWKQDITVRTAKRGVSQFSNEIGRTDILSIGDSLQALFNSASRRSDLRALGMWNSMIVKDDVSVDVVDGRDIYESVYTLTYFTIMDVTR